MTFLAFHLYAAPDGTYELRCGGCSWHCRRPIGDTQELYWEVEAHLLSHHPAAHPQIWTHQAEDEGEHQLPLFEVPA